MNIEQKARILKSRMGLIEELLVDEKELITTGSLEEHELLLERKTAYLEVTNDDFQALCSMLDQDDPVILEICDYARRLLDRHNENYQLLESQLVAMKANVSHLSKHAKYVRQQNILA